MGAYAGLAVRAAATGVLVSAGLAGCTAASSGQAAGPSASTRDADGPASATSQGPPVTVYVIADSAVIAIRAAPGARGREIRAGAVPYAVAVTPDGKTAYVVDGYDNFQGNVTPINTATLTTGPVISAGDRLTSIAITPDGRTAYVLSGETGAVIPISTATGKPGAAISPGGAGAFPTAIAITPGGKTAYVPVTVGGYEMVIPIDTVANTPGPPIPVGPSPGPIAIAP